MQAQELMCRCYDGNQNTQPNTLTWNLMGMMNNCVYRVKVGCLHLSGCRLKFTEIFKFAILKLNHCCNAGPRSQLQTMAAGHLPHEISARYASCAGTKLFR